MTAPASATTGLTPEEIRATVCCYLTRYVDDPEILDTGGLLTSGMLDSIAAVGLIAYLEKRFGCQVLDEDLEIANFDSIDAITALVTRKVAR
jgi:methoxymalonate biosynthesis acyl carrier protein